MWQLSSVRTTNSPNRRSCSTNLPGHVPYESNRFLNRSRYLLFGWSNGGEYGTGGTSDSDGPGPLGSEFTLQTLHQPTLNWNNGNDTNSQRSLDLTTCSRRFGRARRFSRRGGRRFGASWGFVREGVESTKSKQMCGWIESLVVVVSDMLSEFQIELKHVETKSVWVEVSVLQPLLGIQSCLLKRYLEPPGTHPKHLVLGFFRDLYLGRLNPTS